MKYRIALHRSEGGYSVYECLACRAAGRKARRKMKLSRISVTQFGNIMSVVDEQLRGEDVREVEIMV